mgnify:CR=1 FL=1
MISRINKKIVLVLGGTGNIGTAISSRLEDNGFVVCRHGSKGKYSADVRNWKETKVLLNKILKEFGKIDVVVNSLSAPIKINNIYDKNWNNYIEHFSVQLKAAVETAKYLVPMMIKNKYGHFINIISGVVVGSPPRGYADYISAKYALLGFSKCFAEELNPKNIYISCVSPDFVSTRLTKIFPAKLGDILASKNKSGRLTLPEDIAKAVLNLINKPKIGLENIIISGGKINNHE